jgi:hypothetical protein
MRSVRLLALLALLAMPTAPARAGGVVIDMPAPPPAEVTAVQHRDGETGASDVGAIALQRYGHARTLPRNVRGAMPRFGPIRTFGFPWWSRGFGVGWFGSGFGRPWGGWGGPWGGFGVVRGVRFGSCF